ncbi:MAG: pre-peptidase C-terminal domain-containing protein [bacterium]
MARRAGVVLWAVWALAACDDGGGGGGAPDAAPDARIEDAALPDAQPGDAVPSDAALPDAAPRPDARVEDAALPDAAPLDAAPPDAALPDTEVAAPCVDGACPEGLRCVADRCVPPCAPDALEPNEGPREATPVEVGMPVDGTLCAGDADWLVFEAGAGPVVVDVAFTHARGDLDVQLFDARGRRAGAADSVTDDERVELEAPVAGRYFLRIYGYEQAENDWRATVQAAPGEAPACPPDADEENDGPEAAAPRAPGRYEGATTCDEDWYRLEACPGRRVTAWARFDHRFGDIDIELYDDRGIRQVRSASTTNDEGVAFRAGRDAPLFLRVFGYGGAINGYDLEISQEWGVPGLRGWRAGVPGGVRRRRSGGRGLPLAGLRRGHPGLHGGLPAGRLGVPLQPVRRRRGGGG